eukprot:457261-Pelagomonas_calceolata.AAC.3
MDHSLACCQLCFKRLFCIQFCPPELLTQLSLLNRLKTMPVTAHYRQRHCCVARPSRLKAHLAQQLKDTDRQLQPIPAPSPPWQESEFTDVFASGTECEKRAAHGQQ